MQNISEVIENFKQGKLKKHTLVCYLFFVMRYSKKDIIDLILKYDLEVLHSEVYEILHVYSTLINSPKTSKSLKNKLKSFLFLDSIDLLEVERYLDEANYVDYIDLMDTYILITKKIPIENNEKSIFKTQDENDIVIPETNLSLQEISDDKLTENYLSLNDIAQKLNLTSKEILGILKDLGWIKKNGLFAWTTTTRAQDEGVLKEHNDIKKENIWPTSVLNHKAFNNLFISDSVGNKVKQISSIDDIMDPELDHENTFKKYTSLVYSKDIQQDVIGDIVDMYYELYDPDGPNKIYEKFFDKYTELYNEFENIQECFLSLEEIDSLDSDQIIEIIETKTDLLLDKVIDASLENQERDLLSTKELANVLSMNYDEILSILSGIGLIELKNEMWSLTTKANELGARQEQDEMLWEMDVVNYILDECKLLLLDMFKNIKVMDEVLTTVTDDKRKQFIDILNDML